ncbi:hypothetical protein F3Y22_tig00000778pilonHSYRG00152 [Hibiscus syriacus]|uniref:Uncharacterized GPI-anchored protein At5g19230-like domain-containing protein n=1 Tax=Hibiscus syriacus TaxID=106335 RepID=A0A6A3CXR2_HIBSY|nr:hypothetical protein F3Y22_tig00000778pilonHSYRG00152 [Hibiscus syriacus]
MKNENAECLADELADEFKTNLAQTPPVPTLFQAPNHSFPTTQPFSQMPFERLSHKGWSSMPACVPNLVPSLVLTNLRSLSTPTISTKPSIQESGSVRTETGSSSFWQPAQLKETMLQLLPPPVRLVGFRNDVIITCYS